MPTAEKIDLGNGSELLYFEKFFERKQAHAYLDSLNKELPWIRPTLRVYGKNCEQPRETCYVADEGLPTYKYSGYQPIVYKWEDFPLLKSIADAVHAALPSCTFNSVLVNRYNDGSDYAGWHADAEKVYGSTPTIASITLGTEREFLIRRRRSRKLRLSSETDRAANKAESQSACNVSVAKLAQKLNGTKRKSCTVSTNSNAMESSLSSETPRGLYTFKLKHGSLLVMQGYTQRDWEHSVPRRKRAIGLRINLTFRYIMNVEGVV